MRKVIVSEFISVDGVIENPGWTFQFHTEEQDKFKFEELKNCDALLLGRETYTGFAGAWPNMTEEGLYAEWMNNYPKYVVSTTLENPEWNNSTVIKGDLTEEINKLKAQPGKDIVVFGSATLVQSLLKLGLVDELRLMVYPIIKGTGKRLYDEAADDNLLKLVSTETFPTGVVVLTYHKA
ncbi:dihydrofolate reductase family protein [Paenibacillus sp. N1-5-1-14]|uniref:dihydrofolate reductase family protein n=1 Tax=Paenibacillus radicibacter TaxID=2972488 RepID=UPI00215954F9|nr:dihydrofolate reductase family protein [Paenibacillus radicibacter]MCR8643285.1 dihydrofolate reductase family protein [Paenibacillus radicibacter]